MKCNTETLCLFFRSIAETVGCVRMTSEDWDNGIMTFRAFDQSGVEKLTLRMSKEDVYDIKVPIPFFQNAEKGGSQ